ncbi:MAG TPA: hypothetical protein VGC41_00455, partial [Kofleriaceae bacterium]
MQVFIVSALRFADPSTCEEALNAFSVPVDWKRNGAYAFSESIADVGADGDLGDDYRQLFHALVGRAIEGSIELFDVDASEVTRLLHTDEGVTQLATTPREHDPGNDARIWLSV